MKRLALLLALLPSPLTAQELSRTPTGEAAQHRAERELHPERWRQTPWGRQWLHLTPTGDASLQRWDRGPTAHTGSQSNKYLPPQRQEPSQAVIIRELRAEIARLQQRLEQLDGNHVK